MLLPGRSPYNNNSAHTNIHYLSHSNNNDNRHHRPPWRHLHARLLQRRLHTTMAMSGESRGDGMPLWERARRHAALPLENFLV
jgi:hypothetical protein